MKNSLWMFYTLILLRIFDTVVHTIILEKLVTHVLDMVVYKSPGKGD